jgi:hypothetical protein
MGAPADVEAEASLAEKLRSGAFETGSVVLRLKSLRRRDHFLEKASRMAFIRPSLEFVP